VEEMEAGARAARICELEENLRTRRTWSEAAPQSATPAAFAAQGNLPKPWVQYWSKELQRYYYHNTETWTSTWEAPEGGGAASAGQQQGEELEVVYDLERSYRDTSFFSDDPDAAHGAQPAAAGATQPGSWEAAD